MSNESQGAGVDYAAVLADLEARRSQIDAAIAVIKGLMAGGLPPVAAIPASTIAVSSQGPAASGSGLAIESDTFFGLSILEATKKYLAMKKRPTSGPEIVDALRRGGQINAANESFGNTLGATLSRSESGNGPVIRVGRGLYGLREWYPNKPKADSD